MYVVFIYINDQFRLKDYHYQYIIYKGIHYSAISLIGKELKYMAEKVKKLTDKAGRGCSANTQLPHCACQRVHGRIGKDCMWMNIKT